MQELEDLWAIPAVRAGTIIIGSIIAAKLAEAILHRTIGWLARKTTNTVDDIVVDALRRPVFLSFVLIGLAWAATELPIKRHVVAYLFAGLETLGVLIWTAAAFRISHAILTALSRRGKATSIVQPRTMPVFEMLVKLVVVGTAIYFMFLAWQIDLTAWLASAGIIGIAVGFAAKDTLANLFSGIFIVADAPYKIDDYIVLDGGLRGQVTKIGLRSTRVLTQDDVEITVPNAVIGASKIINETGGPWVKQRVGVSVEVAYGSDIDKVREVMLACPHGISHIADHPHPQVRFTAFNPSGLRFELLVWLVEPSQRASVLDALNCAIYKAFIAAKIEIPYAKYDLYIKQLPTTPA